MRPAPLCLVLPLILGDDITATAVLRDAGSQVPTAGEALEIVVDQGIGSNGQESITDISGTVRRVFGPAALGPGVVKGIFYRRGDRWSDAQPFVVSSLAGDLELTGARAALRYGTAEPFEVTLRKDGAPVAGTTIRLWSRGGVLASGPAPLRFLAAEPFLPAVEVVTGPDGKAEATFVAGTETALGGVDAEWGGAETVTARLPILVDGQVIVDLGAVPPLVLAGASADVRLAARAGSVPLAGAAVSLALEGDGALAEPSGFTDATGVFTTRWSAPTSGAGHATLTATVEGGGDQVEAVAIVESAEGAGMVATATAPETCPTASVVWGTMVCSDFADDHPSVCLPADQALPVSMTDESSVCPVSMTVYEAGTDAIAMDFASHCSAHSRGKAEGWAKLEFGRPGALAVELAEVDCAATYLDFCLLWYGTEPKVISHIIDPFAVGQGELDASGRIAIPGPGTGWAAMICIKPGWEPASFEVTGVRLTFEPIQ